MNEQQKENEGKKPIVTSTNIFFSPNIEGVVFYSRHLIPEALSLQSILLQGDADQFCISCFSGSVEVCWEEIGLGAFCLCFSFSPSQNAGGGSRSLLQGVSPTQGSNPGIPHCRRTLPAESAGKPSAPAEGGSTIDRTGLSEDSERH